MTCRKEFDDEFGRFGNSNGCLVEGATSGGVGAQSHDDEPSLGAFFGAGAVLVRSWFSVTEHIDEKPENRTYP